MRHLAERILLAAINLMPESDQDWGQAMRSEFIHFESQRDALSFAFGCYRAAWKRKLMAEYYEPLGRGFVSLCLVIWASAKLYLSGALARAGLYPGQFKANAWDKIDISIWQTFLITGSLFAYAGASFALMTKRWFTLAVCLLGAMMLNSAHFATVSRSGYYGAYSDSRLLFSYAVVVEDYFILTVTIVGVAALYWWPRVMAGQKPWTQI